MIQLITTALLDEVSAAAQASPRRRKNYNFHGDDEHPAHRLLNAIEPGSYMGPHRHAAPKDETMVVLRGRLGLVEFDDAGNVTRTAVLGPGCPAFGINIPHGAWHSVLGLEPGTLILEAKAGPYRPLTAEERAPWAPAEGAAGAEAYAEKLRALFRDAPP